jgi:PAS domain S-box-containing protein
MDPTPIIGNAVLAESEQRLRAIVAQAAFGLAVTDLRGRFLEVNEAYASITGYTVQELSQLDFPSITHPDDRPANLRLIGELLGGDIPHFVIETRNVTKSGREIWVLNSVSLIRDAQGQPANIVALTYDITARKRVEHERHELLARAEVARAEAEQVQRHTAFLADASRVLVSTLDYEATLQSLAGMCVPALADLCVVNLLNDDGAIERVAAAHADPDRDAMVTELRHRFPTDLGSTHPVANVVRTGKPELAREIPEATVGRIAEDPEHLRLAQRLNYASYAVVPLVARGRIIGAMSFVFTESRRRYHERDVPLLEDLAHRAALAIDNARLYKESHERRAAAEALAEMTRLLSQTLSVDVVADRLVTHVRTLLGGTTAIVYRLDPDSGDLVSIAVAGDPGPGFGTRFRISAGVGAAGLAVREQTLVTTPDLTLDPRIRLTETVRRQLAVAPHRAVLAVPLVVHDEVIGALLVGDRPGRTFSAKETALAQSFADHAAIALHNARVYEQAMRGREAEQAARAEAEAANRAKDDFLAVLSHELRTPLTAMLGWTRILRTRTLDEASAARALETIERNSQMQAQLIEDLLDVSRIISGKLHLERRSVPLVPLIHAAVDAVRLAAQAKGVRLETTLSASTRTVWGDASRIQQIVWNLLSNAVKFTPAGGRIDVRLEEDGPEARLTVTDTGCGIPLEVLSHVFERFWQGERGVSTRRFGGLGLGLAIVRHLVELHDGRIEARSPGEGQGAIFTVALPLERTARLPHTAVGNAEVSEKLPLLRGVTVLVVDDDRDTRELLATVLRQAQATVLEADSAAAALKTLERQVPDVLVADLAMPGVDGYELIGRIRAQAGHGLRLPAVAVTAYARGEDRERALSAGFDRHLPKPVDPGELCRTVAKLAVWGRAGTPRDAPADSELSRGRAADQSSQAA